jgi:hypothetical protein
MCPSRVAAERQSLFEEQLMRYLDVFNCFLLVDDSLQEAGHDQE